MYRRQSLRRLGGAVAATTALAGCAGDPPDGTVADADTYRIHDVEAWYAGTFDEYQGALVVAGQVTNESESDATEPTVVGRFFDDAESLLAEREATLRRSSGAAGGEDESGTVSPGESLRFRVVVDEQAKEITTYSISA